MRIEEYGEKSLPLAAPLLLYTKVFEVDIKDTDWEHEELPGSTIDPQKVEPQRHRCCQMTAHPRLRSVFEYETVDRHPDGPLFSVSSSFRPNSMSLSSRPKFTLCHASTLTPGLGSMGHSQPTLEPPSSQRLRRRPLHACSPRLFIHPDSTPLSLPCLPPTPTTTHLSQHNNANQTSHSSTTNP